MNKRWAQISRLVLALGLGAVSPAFPDAISADFYTVDNPREEVFVPREIRAFIHPLSQKLSMEYSQKAGGEIKAEYGKAGVNSRGFYLGSLKSREGQGFVPSEVELYFNRFMLIPRIDIDFSVEFDEYGHHVSAKYVSNSRTKGMYVSELYQLEIDGQTQNIE